MASSDTTHPNVVSDHHHEADGKEAKKEKPKEDNSSELEITVTTTDNNKKTEVPVVAAEFEKLEDEKPEAVAVEKEQEEKTAAKLSEKKPEIEEVGNVQDLKKAGVKAAAETLGEGNVEGEIEKNEGTKQSAIIQSSLATAGSPVSGVVEKADDDDGKNRDEASSVKEEKNNVKSEEVSEEPTTLRVEKSLEGEQGVKVEIPSAVETKNEDKDGAEAEKEVNINAKKADDIDDKKSDPPTKEGDETKTSKEVSDETPAQRPSSISILSKVKQSLGKMKKAIIWKSPSNKTLQQPEDNGEEKVN